MVDDRKLKILRVIIDDFIRTAQPVGSRTLAKKYGLGISSATIRNEMADLEELGFLLQPHTSAGRVPSEEGYRLYVDSLMQDYDLDIKQQDLIRKLLLHRVIEIDDVIHQAAKIMADMTGLVSLISLPQFKKSKLENMKLIKISDSKVMLILVSSSGIVKNLTLAMSDIQQRVLDMISDTLLSKLHGTPIEDITPKAIHNIKQELPEYADLIEYLVPLLRDTLREIDDVDVQVEGINNIFNYVEYQEVAKVKDVYEKLTSKDFLSKVINTRPMNSEVSIGIGKNNSLPEMPECSIVSSFYNFNGKQAGSLCFIGPTRMDYSLTVSVMGYIKETLEGIFSGIYL
ncbi:MAG: heat-inducible transcription repressor HrcA [Clostridia bacterium]|nr:heat-inducible transcription repressor HrcA [Clostridia bacterium]